MKYTSLLSLPILAFLAQACATSGSSTLTGSAIGAGFGAGVGALADPGDKGRNRIRNVFIGATAGSLVGAGTGLLAHNVVEDNEKDAFEKGKSVGQKNASQASANGPTQPTLLPPRIESRFVDDSVRGNVFVPAHFEYVIVEPARWSR